MATKSNDVFAGSYVVVSINRDYSNPNPSYYDPGYISTDNLAQFPEIGVKQDVQSVDDYRDDSKSKMAGDVQVEQTSLVILEVGEDPFLQELDEALQNKDKLRFRNLYVMDIDPPNESSKTGYYSIFDAYVTKMERSGDSTSAVKRTYTLEPEGQLFTGVIKVGEVLRQGDFGVGAGTEEIPGGTDLRTFLGNRWVTVDGSSSDNPFSSDTAAMVLQHPNNVGWDMIGSSSGDPMLRIRNKFIKGDTPTPSKWVKVYSESEKPTPEEVDAVSATNGGEFKSLVKFNSLQVVKDGSQTALVDNSGNATFKTSKTESSTTDNLEVKTKATINEAKISTLNSDTATIATINANTINSVNGKFDNFTATTVSVSGKVIAQDSISGKEIYEGQTRVYSLNNKPLAEDNDFVSKSTGGTFQGPIEVNNKFVAKDTSVASLTSTGKITGSELYEGSIRVYSPNNRPSASDIKAVDIRGDKMTGDLEVPHVVTEGINITSTDSSVASPVSVTATQHTPLHIQRTGPNAKSNLSIGFQQGDNPTFYLGLDTNASLCYGVNSNHTMNAKVYTESYKPTAADVQAIPENASLDMGTF
ncbi:hypothetical protein [Pantoea stewartii]|uniref:hypothetical protein n=1 Tax=Pantoea stewartii TaxID=66269 RepID=UPI00197F0EA9|nr:hypothetical protein [Pantoea stewartii]